jgi:hypothetical protein
MLSKENEKQATISRGAMFGGALLGAVIAIGGFWIVPKLGVPGWASLVLEIATVALALSVVTRIWRRSASASLDSGAGDPDRGE